MTNIHFGKTKWKFTQLKTILITQAHLCYFDSRCVLDSDYFFNNIFLIEFLKHIECRNISKVVEIINIVWKMNT